MNETNITENISPQDNNREQTLTDTQVTSHTSSLWKYVPVPDNTPEKYPDSEAASEFDEKNGISVIAAKVRGKKHKHEGTNCDDSFSFTVKNGIVYAAVSDGAGSKPLSRIGAKFSCEKAVDHMEQAFDDFFAEYPDAFSAVGYDKTSPQFSSICSSLAAIIRNAAEIGIKAAVEEYEKCRSDDTFSDYLGRKPEWQDFAATLLLAAVIPAENNADGKKENLVIAVQIGDGMIAAIDRNAPFETALTLLGSPDRGEFSGETDFITSAKSASPESIMSHTKVFKRSVTDILMMTDGVADDYFPNDPNLLRLYLDLRANGIIGGNTAYSGKKPDFAKKIPLPEEYPWVNDGDISYAYQYMINVIEKTGKDLKYFWENPDAVEAVSLANFRTANPEADSPEEKLMMWLDNYVRRGSFDDRTLLMISC